MSIEFIIRAPDRTNRVLEHPLEVAGLMTKSILVYGLRGPHGFYLIALLGRCIR